MDNDGLTMMGQIYSDVLDQVGGPLDGINWRPYGKKNRLKTLAEWVTLLLQVIHSGYKPGQQADMEMFLEECV